jgi:hypothetical protein
MILQQCSQEYNTITMDAKILSRLCCIETKSINSSPDWDKLQLLSTECINELLWWKNNLHLWNGKSILPQTPHNICRRQRQWMGMQLTTTEQPAKDSIWPLDPPRSINVHQLERTQGSVSRIKNFSISEEHEDSHTNRQHDVDVLHEQTRGNKVTTVDGTCNDSVEMVSPTRHHHTVQSHSWRDEHNCRLRVPTAIPQEQLDDRPQDIPSNITTSGNKRRGSFCGPEHQISFEGTYLGFQIRATSSPTPSLFLGTSFAIHTSTHLGT